MTSPKPNPDDPTSSTTNTMTYLFPLLTIWWGGLFPSGLILYWVVYTAYLIVQQYRIMGWGNLFPLFGWQPSFAPQVETGLVSRPPRRETAEPDNPGKSTASASTPRPGGSPGRCQPPRRPAPTRKRRGQEAMTFREFTGKNVEEAIRTAMKEFSAELADLDIEILSQGSRGILGVGGEEARILAAPKSAVAAAETVRDIPAEQSEPPPPRAPAARRPAAAPPPAEEEPVSEQVADLGAHGGPATRSGWPWPGRIRQIGSGRPRGPQRAPDARPFRPPAARPA